MQNDVEDDVMYDAKLSLTILSLKFK